MGCLQRYNGAIPKLLAVRSTRRYCLWLRYDDGVEGEVDLSHLAGRGVFRAWEKPGAFEAVRLGAQRQIAWGDDLDLCPDALYLKLTGKTPDKEELLVPK